MSPADPIEPEGIFEGLSGAAIALGALADIAASVVVFTLVMFFVSPGQLSEDEAAAAEALEAFYASGPLVALELALGLSCTVFGAFLGARRAGQLHVRHGGWIAVASTALIVPFALLAPPDATAIARPFWAEILGWLLIIPSGVAGGALAEALEAPP